jgi:hypothetical protein
MSSGFCALALLLAAPAPAFAVDTAKDQAAIAAAIAELSTNANPLHYKPSEGRLLPEACFAVIGLVTRVRPDPHAFGMDVELQHTVWPNFTIAAHADRNPQETLVAFIPKDDDMRFSDLDSYVGKPVALFMTNDRYYETITMPGQLQLLSTAVADPQKTWCHLSYIQRRP